jgi:uncharacterized protein DUF3626
VDTEPWQRALAHVASLSHGPPLGEFDITVHFHPDRLVDGVPLLRHLADDGVYRSQFETSTSNGGLTACMVATSGAGSTVCSAARTTTHHHRRARSTVR